MNHTDHVRLLRGGVTAPSGTWADLGAGRGAFTLALAELLGAGGTIYAVDRDGAALADLARAVAARAPEVTLHTVRGDFTRTLDLPPLDGVVMANSLHYVKDKAPVVRRIASYLRPEGRLLVVEYDTDSGNPWVPYPFSLPVWQRIARQAGFAETTLLATAPTSFMGRFYAAMSVGFASP